MPEFTALRVYEKPEGRFERVLEQRYSDDLPPGDVLIRVHYSSLNYKDALSATGHKGVTRRYPHTPGVDAAGTVSESTVSEFQNGDEVIVTGYDLGMNTDGGFAGYIRVPAAWVVKLPPGLSLQECMIYGTAGFTSAQCVVKLQHMGVTPEQGEILVTGASGGVGSMGVALLAQLGYRVVAMSGKPQAHDWLRELGAAAIIGRDGLADDPERPLLKARWAGVLDTVGGGILAAALRGTQQRGSVTCCGLVASPELPITVYPFILRGINLLGVDSAATPMAQRLEIWRKLAEEWKLAQLERLICPASLQELNEMYLDRILQGEVQGRVVVHL